MELATALLYYAAIVLIVYIVLVWCKVAWFGALVVSLAVGWIFLLALFPPNRMMAFTSSNAGGVYAFILVFTLILIFFYAVICAMHDRVKDNCLTRLVENYCTV